MKNFLTYLLTALLLVFVVGSKVYTPAQENLTTISAPHQLPKKVNHLNKTMVKTDHQQNDAPNFFVESEDVDFSAADQLANLSFAIGIVSGLFLLIQFFEKKRTLAFQSAPRGIPHVKRFILIRSIRI